MPIYRVKLSHTNLFRAANEAEAIDKAYREVFAIGGSDLYEEADEVSVQDACAEDDEWCGNADE